MCQNMERMTSGIDLGFMMDELGKMGIGSVLVEGGGTTISSFFKAGLVDVFTVYVGSMVIGGKDAPTPADGTGWVAEGGLALRLRSAERLGDGIVLEYVLG